MYYRLLYLGFKIYCFIFRPVRMGVRILMVQKNEVLLVWHTYLSGWYLPGGGLKRNETLESAARREAFEETGAELGEVKLLGIFSSFSQWKTDHTVVFYCDDFEIKGTPDKEIAKVNRFQFSELPNHVYGSHRKLLESYMNGKVAPQGEW